ncbi:acyltransferase family protein [Arcticibacter sp.]|uniref:acyltransferase family protein n=1 Tax=Arcticibacter sp. TaxID=1872630 RepID=UPI00388D4491
MTVTSKRTDGRVLSLDVLRGLIMLLLCAESCAVYVALSKLQPVQPFAGMVNQFFHHPWHGLRFWDLVQPAFMFMAGAAMYISYSRKLAKGISWSSNFRHVLWRSAKLFICGVALHCAYQGELVWELWNVLTQLAFTTVVAYLIIKAPFVWQLLFSIALLLVTELLYRMVLVPGFDQPFVESHNFGSYMDTLLMGKINSDGWVAINAVPTAAHTIWGVLTGKLLVSARPAEFKIRLLMISGVLALLAGFSLDLAGVTPIIKRISTSSFVLASGGWVLLMQAFIYWLVDVKQNVKYAWFFSVMGMNAIFIYLFFETVGMQWVNGTVHIFTGGLLQTFFDTPSTVAALISALAALALEWGLCYWLYKQKIFFKL